MIYSDTLTIVKKVNPICLWYAVAVRSHFLFRSHFSDLSISGGVPILRPSDLPGMAQEIDTRTKA